MPSIDVLATLSPNLVNVPGIEDEAYNVPLLRVKSGIGKEELTRFRAYIGLGLSGAYWAVDHHYNPYGVAIVVPAVAHPAPPSAPVSPKTFNTRVGFHSSSSQNTTVASTSYYDSPY